MRLTYRNGIFIAECSYDERTAPKAAGFLWHGGNCRPGCAACAAGLGRSWWTKRTDCAVRLKAHADAAAQAALGAHVAAVEASRAASVTPEVAGTLPCPEGLAYLPFQAAGIQYAAARPRVLIADEMGLGKTVQALGVINADTSIKRVLIVCPASLRLNWQREAGRWLVRPLTVVVVDSNAIPEADVVVVNYDRLKGPLLDALMAREWDLVVADEAHYAKNHRAKRTVALLGRPARKDDPGTRGLASRTRRLLLLTGTPLLNKPIELHPLLTALAPEVFGGFGFLKRYCAAHQGRYGWDFSGAAHLDELQERMRATCMVRRLKKDVLAELPAKRRQIIELPANGTARALRAEQAASAQWEARLADLRDEADLAHAAGDEAAYKAAVVALRDASGLAFAEMSRARHDLAIAKAPHVVEHIESLIADGLEKVVVFAHHKDVVQILVDGLGEHGVVTITGETPMADRQAAVDRFQADTACRIFVGNIQAAGVGLTLTAASTVIFAELDWVPANVTQAEDRCHRIGQRASVLVQHLVVDCSLDARMAKALVAKQALADAALDDAADEIVVPTTRSPRPRQYPAATETQRAAALACLRGLASVCDGAHAKDECGFNALDARIGKRLAALDDLTDGQVWLATRILPKYHRQLNAARLAAALGKVV